MQTFKDLKVWNKSIDLAVDLYKATMDLPQEEKYGLTSQMRRSGVSVPSNIAEGYGRYSDKETVHFSKIANGSLAELETQLIICERLGMIEQDKIDNLTNQIEEVGRMLTSFIKSKEK